MHDVVPLRANHPERPGYADPGRPRPAPFPRCDRNPGGQTTLEGTGHGSPLLDFPEDGYETAWSRVGQPRSTLRDLRRGRWAMQAYLDLHGHDRNGARTAFDTFITRCAGTGYRCVRIIHGKGLGSPDREPVLKRLVLTWLPQKDEVLAFCQAGPADGGAGAVRVLLRTVK
ncbi:MAG: Smr/MutS family protein [Proteobacteria bacterium]|nr:Smr/MutS family protein [Pseudomonadota bacterium]